MDLDTGIVELKHLASYLTTIINSMQDSIHVTISFTKSESGESLQLILNTG